MDRITARLEELRARKNGFQVSVSTRNTINDMITRFLEELAWNVSFSTFGENTAVTSGAGDNGIYAVLTDESKINAAHPDTISFRWDWSAQLLTVHYLSTETATSSTVFKLPLKNAGGFGLDKLGADIKTALKSKVPALKG